MHAGAKKNRERAVERAKKVEELKAKGLTNAEVGETLGCSEDVVRQIISRHKKRTSLREPVRKFYIRRSDENNTN